jgi:uncharacterized protein YndB with AHSA1/START domain
MRSILEATPVSEREAIFTRWFNAPRELVYEAFTDPKHVAHWWGPDGFTTSTHVMDVRVGGMRRYIMHGPDGRDYTNRMVFSEVKPPEKLVYEHGEDIEEDPLRFHVTVTFEPQNGGTLLTMRMLFASAAQWQETRKYAVPGHAQTMDRLEQFLSQRKDLRKLGISLPSETEIRMERTFHVPIARVWDAWTRPEILKQWMGNVGRWYLDTCAIDLRVGGRYRYVWRGQDGGEMGMGGTFLTIDPPHRLVATELFDEDWTDGETISMLELTGREGITYLTNTVKYPTRKGRDMALSSPMDEGMETSFDLLEKLLK